MGSIKEQYRLAFACLMDRTDKKIEGIADAVSCTSRHLQGVLSEQQGKGLSHKLGQKVAEVFGLTYNDMLAIGRDIMEGRDPDKTMVNYGVVGSNLTALKQKNAFSRDVTINKDRRQAELSAEEQTLVNLLREKDNNKLILRRIIADLIMREPDEK